MSLIVNSIQIITCDIKAYSSFLVDVFDLELKVDECGVFYTYFSNLKINIIEMRGFKSFHFLTPFLTIEIESKIEISNYYDKYQFYLYRKNASNADRSIKNTSTEIFDPDGRIWSFKISNQNHHYSQSQNANSIII